MPGPLQGECWIPDEVLFDSSSEEWATYEQRIYGPFYRDFAAATPKFRGPPVRIRTNPRFDGKEEAFWHLTCRDYRHTENGPTGRDPDLERCTHIRWPRAFLEHPYPCPEDCEVLECDSVWTWEVTRHTKKGKTRRVKLYSPYDRYLVVLEERKGYWLLITAYVANDICEHERITREAVRNKAVYAGSAVTALPEGSFHARRMS